LFLRAARAAVKQSELGLEPKEGCSSPEGTAAESGVNDGVNSKTMLDFSTQNCLNTCANLNAASSAQSPRKTAHSATGPSLGSEAKNDRLGAMASVFPSFFLVAGFPS
jgi:hypothetical protein